MKNRPFLWKKRDAIGEQKLECREFLERLRKISIEYEPGIVCGGALQFVAMTFLVMENSKEEFMESCSEIYDSMAELNGKYLEKLNG